MLRPIRNNTQRWIYSTRTKNYATAEDLPNRYYSDRLRLFTGLSSACNAVLPYLQKQKTHLDSISNSSRDPDCSNRSSADRIGSREPLATCQTSSNMKQLYNSSVLDSIRPAKVASRVKDVLNATSLEKWKWVPPNQSTQLSVSCWAWIQDLRAFSNSLMIDRAFWSRRTLLRRK